MPRDRSGRNASPEQVLELLYKLAIAAGITRHSSDHVQWMSDNMREIGPYFEHFIDTQGLRDIQLITTVERHNESKAGSEFVFTVEEQLTWFRSEISSNGLTSLIDHTSTVKTMSRNKFHLLLMRPHTNPKTVQKEFAIRRCDPATPFEIAYLLHRLRTVGEPQHALVSTSGSPVFAYRKDYNKFGRILLTDKLEDEERMWSYVGAIRS